MVNYNNEKNVEDDSTAKMLWYVNFQTNLMSFESIALIFCVQLTPLHPPGNGTVVKKNIKFGETRCKKSLKIPKEKSESVYRRRTDNTMAKRKSIKEQTTIKKTYI